MLKSLFTLSVNQKLLNLQIMLFSTNGMVNHAKTSSTKEFIIGTEKGLCYRLEKEISEKKFYPVPTAICPNMKKTTLDKVLKSIETLEPKINLTDEIMKKAYIPLQRMIEIT